MTPVRGSASSKYVNLLLLVALGTMLFASRSPAQDQHARPRPSAPTQRTHARPKAPGTQGKTAPGTKTSGAHQADTHGGHAAHDENAPPPPINWWHGLLGKKEGVHPNLLWRSPEEPPPFLASVINFALFAFIVAYFGKKPLAAALAKRRESIMRDIEDAQRTRQAAENRLKEYEAKLERMEEEAERLRREFREQGEREKARIIAEANERRERMRQDAQLLLSHELDQMRHDLMKEAVDEASRIATELLAQRMTLADQERFVEAFFLELRSNREQAVGGRPS